jgi:hypothetical protein
MAVRGWSCGRYAGRGRATQVLAICAREQGKMRAHRAFQHRPWQRARARRVQIGAAHRGEPLVGLFRTGGQQMQQMPLGRVGPQDVVEQHDE